MRDPAATGSQRTEPRLASDRRGPVVSVIIPVHNRAATIGRAIESALAQTYRRIEILVVDDASTDDLAAVMAKFPSPPVRMVSTGGRSGAAAARNLGIARSSGPLVAFLDSDDAWDRRKLEFQVDCLEGAPAQVGAVYAGIRTHHPDGQVTETRPEHRGHVFDVLRWRNKIGGASSVMVRRAVLDEIGLFDTGLPACEDWDLWARIARRYHFDFVAAPCVDYHADRPDRLSRRARSVFIANHRIFRRLNGRRPAARNLSMHLALQSRELYWLGRRRLAVKLALRAIWTWPAQRERIAVHTLKWALRRAVARYRIGGGRSAAP